MLPSWPHWPTYLKEQEVKKKKERKLRKKYSPEVTFDAEGDWAIAVGVIKLELGMSVSLGDSVRERAGLSSEDKGRVARESSLRGSCWSAKKVRCVGWT